MSKKEIALTFDDGPWGETTSRILDELIARKIPATFMIWGEHVLQYPELLEKAAKSGLFAFGNHTFHHLSLLDLTAEEIKEELELTDRLVKKYTGIVPAFVRPPFGDADAEILKIIHRPIICWSLDTRSWEHHDATLVLQEIQSAQDGDIVLMHDFQEADANALPAVLDFLEAENFVFKTVPDLLGEQLDDEAYIYYSQNRRDKVGFENEKGKK